MAEKAIERVHKLQADGAISDKEVAQAEADFARPSPTTARAAAQLKALGLSATDPAVNVALRAQIAGVVVERNVLVGQEVRADGAAPLLTISSLDTVWVLADVYEQDLGLVAEGGRRSRQRARPTRARRSPARSATSATWSTPPPAPSRSAASSPNPGHRLKPEMFAKIEVRRRRQAAR